MKNHTMITLPIFDLVIVYGHITFLANQVRKKIEAIFPPNHTYIHTYIDSSVHLNLKLKWNTWVRVGSLFASHKKVIND